MLGAHERDVFIYGGGSADAVPLAGMIHQALENAGWNVRVWNTMSPMRWVRGVLVYSQVGATAEQKVIVEKLIAALRSLGIAAGPFEQFPIDPNPPEGGIMGPAWTGDKRYYGANPCTDFRHRAALRSGTTWQYYALLR